MNIHIEHCKMWVYISLPVKSNRNIKTTRNKEYGEYLQGFYKEDGLSKQSSIPQP